MLMVTAIKIAKDVRRLNERREITLRHAQGHEVVMVQLATTTAPVGVPPSRGQTSCCG